MNQNLYRMTSLYLLPVLLAAPTGHAEEVTYADLAALVQTRCVLCHSGPAAPLGLKLDSLDNLLAGSQNGPVVKAGNPAESELIRRLKGLSLPRMPMTGPPFLTEQEIDLFERWVAAGLPHGAPPPAAAVARAELRAQPGEPVSYARVAPIFAQRCAKCHAEGRAPEGYVLTSYQATVSRAERARVVPGFAEASELVRRIRGQALPRMPHDGPPYLDDAEIALISAWINQGARDAQGNAAPSPSGARVRLHGRLGAGWTLDGLRLIVDSATRVDNAPVAGDYVQVRGRIAADGSVVAERIKPRALD
ncbi:c-type cytochrome domain-containing protein [Pseudomonas cavernicola]|nr:c-type cytochrome domain-containing protein [Pseudomonas cavernicola]